MVSSAEIMNKLNLTAELSIDILNLILSELNVDKKMQVIAYLLDRELCYLKSENKIDYVYTSMQEFTDNSLIYVIINKKFILGSI